MNNSTPHPGSATPGRVVVIGASAGGIAALRTLVSQLPPDLSATLLIVLHIGAFPSLLPEMLSAAGPLPAEHAKDGQSLLPEPAWAITLAPIALSQGTSNDPTPPAAAWTRTHCPGWTFAQSALG